MWHHATVGRARIDETSVNGGRHVECTDVNRSAMRERGQPSQDEAEAELGAWDLVVATGELVWSQRCRSILGLDAALDLPRFLDLVPPGDRDRLSHALDRALETGVFSCEHRVRRPDGVVRWLVCHARVLFDDAGRPTRVLGTMLDVTERSSAQARLAEESSRARALRDRVLSVVSHDLRTPLTAIDLSGAVLLDLTASSESPVVRRQLEMIRRNAARMGGLIADLVDLANIQAGRFALTRQPTPLAPLVADALAPHERGAIDRAITLIRESELGDAEVDVDRERVERVLSTIAAGAIERAARGGTVTIRVDRLDHDRARIRVHDSGSALSADELELLFELGGRKRSGKLVLARSIARAHGGELEAAPEPGGGNTVTLTLPLAPPHSAEGP